MRKYFLPCLILFMADMSAQVGTGNVGINTEAPEKTLDVNGNFRSQKTDSSTSTQYLLETNSLLDPAYNLATVTNSSDGTGALLYQNKDFSGLNQTNSNGEFSRLILFGTPGSPATRLDSSSGTLNTYMYTNPLGLYMDAQDILTGRSNSFFIPNSTIGPSFSYKDTSGTITGQYYLPRNYGLRGQVLVTHGNPSAAGNGGMVNNLVWRNVADLIVLKSPGGNCYKITVSDTGVLGTTPDSDCMVDPYDTTTYSTTSRMAAGSTDKTLADPNKMIEEQKKQIEEMQKQMKEIRSKLIHKNAKNTK
ncbi:hypothetical protein ACQWU4_11410 [Chryseobacterium sp. MIQD13]|uniref:hypothetical protein n=1 Tax=Chryseobacterium sp. MIQD13 TaxID=3422310 RepID=UPI003D2BF9D1